MTGIQKVSLKHYMHLPVLYIVLIVLFVYSLVVRILPIDEIVRRIYQGTSEIYIAYYDFFSFRSIPIIIVPLFLILLDISTAMYGNYYISTRFANIKEWWNAWFKNTGIVSLVFTIVLNILAFVNIYVKYVEQINLTFLKFELYCIWVQTLGFIIFALIYNILFFCTGKKHIGFIGAMLPSFMDFVFLKTRLNIRIYVTYVS